MATMTKKEIVDRIAKRTSTKYLTIKTIIQCFLDETISELGKGNRLEFRDFGVFEVSEAAPRTAQNPKTLGKKGSPCKANSKVQDGADYEAEGECQVCKVVSRIVGTSCLYRDQVSAFQITQQEQQKWEPSSRV